MLTIKGVIARGFMYLCRIFPITNKVVFSSFDGKNFGDDPKALFDEMIKQGIETEYIWLLDDIKFDVPENVKLVKAFSILAIYHLATAKVWVDNCRKHAWTVKRKGQYYIQTWHSSVGGVGIKKVEKDAEDFLPKPYIEAAINDSKMADLFISGSAWITQYYKDAFWYSGKILECGNPVADNYFKNVDAARKRVHEFYNLDSTTKIILYSPTFRDDLSMTVYDMNYEAFRKAVEKRWGGHWVVIVRFHPNLRYKQTTIKFTSNILDGLPYGDICDQMIACDIVVSDYSCCAFDGMQLNKKVILYCPDLEEYKNNRGILIDIEKLPFPMAKTNDELNMLIENFDEEEYRKEVNSYRANIQNYNDGHASETVVDIIKKQLGM